MRHDERFVVAIAGWLSMSMGLGMMGCGGERPVAPEEDHLRAGAAHEAPATGAVRGRRHPPPPRVKVEWPSREFRTLQSAVDAAPDGALLEIGEGDFQLDDPLVIQGKRLEIAGAGSGRAGTGRITRLAGPPPRPVVRDGELILQARAAEGLLSSLGADLVVRDVMLTGFDAAIATRDDGESSATTLVKDVVISQTGRGILSLGSGDLTVLDTDIEGTAWHGISFAPLPSPSSGLPGLDVSDTNILTAACAGIFFSDGIAVVANVTVLGGACGGIVGTQAAGGLIVDSFILANTYAGILLSEVPSFLIEDNLIDDTFKIPVEQRFGDGIALFLSSGIQLRSNLITDSDRAGVSVFGSSASLLDNTITCAVFDLNAESEGNVASFLDDLGGNQCGCGEPLGSCVSESSSIEPPVAPDP